MQEVPPLTCSHCSALTVGTQFQTGTRACGETFCFSYVLKPPGFLARAFRFLRGK